jgi:acyl-CoA reductase-like NAD-dependent aldehyde dehydrogenase
MVDHMSQPSDVESKFADLQRAFSREGGLSVDQRRAALKTLRQSLIARADDYVSAIDADFRGRSRHETLLTEVAVVISAIDYTLPKLRKWSSTRKIRLGFPYWPASGEIRPQPRGVAGIIAPSNYPLQLAMMPLIGALSAGCRAMVKPSEFTPRTAALIASHVEAAFAPTVVSVVTGGADVAASLTALPFDIIHFTGSSRVGAMVAQAAAKNMTPVVLELGGKSPVIVDDSADLSRAAQSIIAGKLINAGQTCVAPDYVYVPHRLKDKLIDEMRRAAQKFYPKPDGGDYTAIASDQAIDRQNALADGHSTSPLFDQDLAAPLVAPRLIDAPADDSRIMREEIFGPLLPIFGYGAIDEVIDRVNALPEALVIYWFGDRNRNFESVADKTLSGSISVNETVLQAGVNALPFGGIGRSGIGRYHGKAGFDSFSHERVIFNQSRMSITGLMRPPYGKVAERILRGLLR